MIFSSRNAVSYLVLDQSCNFTTEGAAHQPQTKTLLPHKRRDAKQVLDLKFFFCLRLA